MTMRCCVLSCKNIFIKDSDIKFYRLPRLWSRNPKLKKLSEERQILWRAALKRRDLNFEGHRICSRHFISGKRANLLDRFNPDWVPSLHLEYEQSKNLVHSKAQIKQNAEALVANLLTSPNQEKSSTASQAAVAPKVIETENYFEEEEFLQDSLDEDTAGSSSDSIDDEDAMETEEDFKENCLEGTKPDPYGKSIAISSRNIPIKCCVPHCKNVRNKGQSKYKFFRFPNAKESSEDKLYRSERQAAWIKAINRIDITPLNAACKIICSDHFMLGTPASSRDKSHPDWVPNKNLPTTLTKAVRRNKYEQKNNFLKIEKAKTDEFDPLAEEEIQVEEVVPSDKEVLAKMKIERMGKEIEQLNKDINSLTKQLAERDSQIIDQEAELHKLNEIHKWEIKEKESVFNNLEHRYLKISLSREGFKNDDKKVNYFTGLPSFAVLEIIYNFVKEELTCSMSKGINTFDAFILVLLKLRLDLPMAYLGYRYGIAGNTVSSMIRTNLKALSDKIGPFIRWPEKSALRENTPIYFKKVLGNGFTALIDFIENPGPEVSEGNLIKNNYKPTKHLVAISPAGAIIFVSKGYDSTLSVKEIAESCGLLDYTEDGDIILSDHGKAAHQVFSFNGSKVLMQSLDNKENDLLDSLLQNPVQDKENSTEVNNCRVYIQRALSVLKNKFFILTKKYKFGMAKSYKNEEDCYFDYVVKVCCALVNVSPTLLSFDTNKN